MKTQQLTNYVNKVICVDLVNGERPVAKFKEITLDGVCVFSDPRLYIPVSNNGGNVSVTAVPYGAPLFKVDTLKVDANHILSIIEIPKQMEDAYRRETSSLVTPPSPGLIIPT